MIAKAFEKSTQGQVQHPFVHPIESTLGSNVKRFCNIHIFVKVMNEAIKTAISLFFRRSAIV